MLFLFFLLLSFIPLLFYRVLKQSAKATTPLRYFVPPIMHRAFKRVPFHSAEGHNFVPPIMHRVFKTQIIYRDFDKCKKVPHHSGAKSPVYGDIPVLFLI